MDGKFYGVQACIKQKGQGYDRAANMHVQFYSVQAHIKAERSRL